MNTAVAGIQANADALFPRAGGLTPPYDVVLSWPTPNYENPESRGWAAPIILIIVAVITTMVFIARMWARVVISKNAGLDDWLMTAAMIPLWGLTVSSCLAITVYGFQWHTWDQTAETLITTRKITLAIEVTYLMSTTLIKISILCFYRRMTSGSISKTFLYIVWAFIGFVFAYSFTFMFIIVFSCKPVAGYWHLFDISWRLTHEMKCFNEGAITVAVVVVSTFQDLVICALPMILVWNLQIDRRQKLALIGIFGLGLVTCLCGVLRMYYAIEVYYGSYDITWVAFNGWVWTTLEADLAVICASAPALKVFFLRYFNLSSANRSYGYSNAKGRKKSAFGSRPPGQSSGSKTGGASKGGSVSWETQDVPLDRIKVSRKTNITVQDRRRSSDASTNNLTAIPPSPGLRTSPQWDLGSTTFIGALPPMTGENRHPADSNV